MLVNCCYRLQFCGEKEVLGTRYKAYLAEEEVGKYSTYRELQAVEEGLRVSSWQSYDMTTG